ncbi:hypothetical protein BgiMline_004286, partial [Biomphalaria glabrata]
HAWTSADNPFILIDFSLSTKLLDQWCPTFFNFGAKYKRLTCRSIADNNNSEQ